MYEFSFSNEDGKISVGSEEIYAIEIEPEGRAGAYLNITREELKCLGEMIMQVVNRA
jgi:hypothetical protein